MYKKAINGLLLVNLILLAGAFCVEGISFSRAATVPAYEWKLDEAVTADHKSSTMGMVFRTASGQRIVDYGVLDRPEEAVYEAAHEAAPGAEHEAAYETASLLKYQLCEEDYDILLRIVEAEAGGEDSEGKLLVANVVLNRVNHEEFPDTVSEVVTQHSDGVYQFSPVGSGSIWNVRVSEDTVSAVQRALEGEDISRGALYFAARKHANAQRMKWFDENLTFLFRHGGHEFFTG